MGRLLARIAAGAAAVSLGTGHCSALSALAADVGHGRAVFASQCSACHSNTKNGAVVLGPPLYGVVGRKAGSIAGFNYSSAMKASGLVWSPDKLRAYLPAPRGYLPGVRMTYPGLKDPAKLDDLIAYLQTLR